MLCEANLRRWRFPKGVSWPPTSTIRRPFECESNKLSFEEYSQVLATPIKSVFTSFCLFYTFFADTR